jgi:hypothetical protein
MVIDYFDRLPHAYTTLCVLCYSIYAETYIGTFEYTQLL